MSRHPKPLSIRWFSLRVAGMFTLLLIIFSQIFPTIWQQNLEAGLLANFATFIAMVMVNCFSEWFFHRYVLHSAPIGWVKDFAADHRNHHSLTKVSYERGIGAYLVKNDFPITRDEQFEDAKFPWWALPAFWALFTLPFFILNLALPQVPFLLAGYGALAWSAWFYEALHSTEHLPLEWWQCKFDRRFGGFWRKLYSFHLTHHADIKCNEAISGFFGLPLADWVFGTYYEPSSLLLDGKMANLEDFKMQKKPRRFVVWLDKIALGLEQRRRKRTSREA